MGVNSFLFPSKKQGKGFRPSARNPIGHQAFLAGLAQALASACGVARDVIVLYTGHSLRVGGFNYWRKRGAGSRALRILGGWASEHTATHYEQMSTAEKFSFLASAAASKGGDCRAVVVSAEADRKLARRLAAKDQVMG